MIYTLETIYQKAFLNARLHQKKTLCSFANTLSVNKAYISRIENNKVKPSMALLRKLERVTGFSFWALAKGDFDILNQENYVKLSNLNFNNMTIKLSDMNATQRSYLQNKFDVEIKEVKDKIAEAKSNLAKKLEKSSLGEVELDALEAEVQSNQTTLDFLTSANASAEMIAAQKNRLTKAENDLAEKKRKGGMISDEDGYLEQVAIELLELGIKVREEKIAEIKAIG